MFVNMHFEVAFDVKWLYAEVLCLFVFYVLFSKMFDTLKGYLKWHSLDRNVFTCLPFKSPKVTLQRSKCFCMQSFMSGKLALEKWEMRVYVVYVYKIDFAYESIVTCPNRFFYHSINKDSATFSVRKCQIVSK